MIRFPSSKLRIDISENGDSLPNRYITKEQLDKDLDEMLESRKKKIF